MGFGVRFACLLLALYYMFLAYMLLELRAGLNDRWNIEGCAGYYSRGAEAAKRLLGMGNYSDIDSESLSVFTDFHKTSRQA